MEIVTFSFKYALNERKSAIFAFRIRSFLDKEPIVFRILLKNQSQGQV